MSRATRTTTWVSPSYKSITDNVLLGTDGMHNDMLRSAKAAFLTGQATEGIGFDEIYPRFRDVHRYASEFGLRGDTENNLVSSTMIHRPR